MCFPTPTNGREGEGDLGITEDNLACVVSLVVQAARRTRKALPLVQGHLDENRISVVLHQELQVAQRRRRLRSFEFIPEGILNPPQGRRGRIAGRIDFKVKFREQISNYDAYFGVESKRLGPRRPSLARYYMAAGVGKFAKGPYSVDHPSALLLGYVIAPGPSSVLGDLRRRLAAAHPDAAPLATWLGSTYRDALVVEGMVPRQRGAPIRLLHALVQMHA